MHIFLLLLFFSSKEIKKIYLTIILAFHIILLGYLQNRIIGKTPVIFDQTAILNI